MGQSVICIGLRAILCARYDTSYEHRKTREPRCYVPAFVVGVYPAHYRKIESGVPRTSFKSRLSRNSAERLIYDLGLYGDHSFRSECTAEREVRRFLESKGIRFHRLVEETRDFSRNVPYIENLFRGVLYPEQGATVSRVSVPDMSEDSSVSGPGMISRAGYIPQCDESFSQFETAVGRSSYHGFLSAVTVGIAAIESYIRYRAEIWSRANQSSQLTDSSENRMSFDDKIDSWIPTMTGSSLEKGDQVWYSFRILRQLRDDEFVHMKSGASAITYRELAKHMNHFRHGISRLLLRLQMMFGESCPSRIIRLANSREVDYLG